MNPLGLAKRTLPSEGQWRKVLIKNLIGLAMLGAAIWVVASNGEAVEAASRHAVGAHPAIIVAALLLPIANVVAIAVSFWLLNKRYAPVPFGETFALIASAWLLNFLPMRPGMVGRIAYHKRYHGIAVRDSAKVLGINMTLTAAAIGILLLIVLARILLGRVTLEPGSLNSLLTLGLALEHQRPWLVWLPVLLAPGVLAGVGAWLLAWAGVGGWRMTATLVARYADLLIWVARYAVVFELVGHALTIPEAVAIAVVSQLAQLIPLAGNGLGLREWTVGLTAGVLPSGRAGARGLDTTGLAADLVNRGAELVAAAPFGLAAIGWLALKGRLSLQTELGEDDLKDEPAAAGKSEPRAATGVPQRSEPAVEQGPSEAPPTPSTSSGASNQPDPPPPGPGLGEPQPRPDHH